jgi:hypothetical protein
MKKRTVIAYMAMICALFIAFIGGSVLAQGDTPRSTTGNIDPVASYSVFESLPGSNALEGQAELEIGHSTSDGSAPEMNVSMMDESKFQLGDVNVIIPSGGIRQASPAIQEASQVKVEPMPAIAQGNPNAPAWNASIRFAGSTLRPRTSGVGYDTNGYGGCIYATSGSASVVWNLPLALPNGAKVEWLRMYYYDNDTTHAMNGWFSKYDLYGNLTDEWVVNSDDKGNYYNDVLITPTETIDYGSFSYVLNWRPNAANSNLQLCGFRLFYTVPPPTFIPIVNRP